MTCAMACLLTATLASTSALGKPLARVRLYNPTGWRGPTPVEGPVGRLASPGLVDWAHVRLVLGDRDVPFAIREGRPHWKAALVAPVQQPRAEDLLVFSCPVPPRTWVTLNLVAGEPSRTSALRRQDDSLIVTYPGFQATVAAASGLLTSLTVAGTPVLAGPLTGQYYRLTGADGKQRTRLGARPALLVSSASTPAMTELNFVRDLGDGLAISMTYRIYPGGLVEIWADERPRQGASPWVGHAADYALPLAGEVELLPYLINRAPYYGFKDFEAVVKHPAAIHRTGRAAVVELGEEVTNGRRWCRRLYLVPRGSLNGVRDLVELAEQGLVVDVESLTLPWPAQTAQLRAPAAATSAADTIAQSLHRRGVGPTPAPPSAPRQTLTLRLVTGDEAAALSGDGFSVRPEPGGIGLVALTPFGLTQGARRIAEFLDQHTGPVQVPLIASNPASDLRAGGFGGGDHEVDFPYGTDAEWEHAFEGMISSGMNVMADLGMWGNWKLPVTYEYMPELRSNSPDAIDQASGARFSDIPEHRERGLRLLAYLHRRGVKVWDWVPVGCVPSTFGQAHPEAMSPGNPAFPCFTHPAYQRYLEAFAKELLETYPIDGIVMIRDDNGGTCDCDRCKAYVAASRTKSPMWEQYLLLYDWLRSHGFKGSIGVYPYNDPYQPGLDDLLPADLFIVGHGGGAGMLSRSFETLGPMGDTWIDNLFASFRPASTPRMKRLLADRGSFWIGGAYCGTELPWEAIGYFGWEPTATVNSFRYWWGCREFGPANALAFVSLSEAEDHLWDIYDVSLLPQEWVKLDAAGQARVSQAGRARLQQFRERLAALRTAAGDRADTAWFAHVHLFATYFEYLLRRLELFTQMQALVLANRNASPLPDSTRSRLLGMRDEVYQLAAGFDREAAAVPGNMLAATRRAQLTQPFKEWVAGYDSVEWSLDLRQFAGQLTAAPVQCAAGKPFTLRVELQNLGIWPWVPGVGQRLTLSGDAPLLGLPAAWEYEGASMAYGDRRVVELQGSAPAEAGEGAVSVSFLAPFRNPKPFLTATVKLAWR